MKVGFISLGCNKNLVDTEKTISIFKENNYEIVNNPKEAEIIVINTCGFIESAKEEAINTILEMAEYKKQKCKYLIAMGCLVERYKKELENAKTVVWNGPVGLFEFDQFAVGTNSVAEILSSLDGATTIIGGGDSAAAVEKSGLADKMTHISTGGGASLEFLEGKKLPGVECLLNR